MGQFVKGQGGRPKGKPNKATTDLREWINSFIDDNREQIQKDWKKLSPRDRIILFDKLLKYVLPTLQATSLNVDFEKLPESTLDAIIEKLLNKNNGQDSQSETLTTNPNGKN